MERRKLLKILGARVVLTDVLERALALVTRVLAPDGTVRRNEVIERKGSLPRNPNGKIDRKLDGLVVPSVDVAVDLVRAEVGPRRHRGGLHHTRRRPECTTPVPCPLPLRSTD